MVSGNAKKDHILPISDFIPQWSQPPEEEVEEVDQSTLRAKMAAAFGGLGANVGGKTESGG